MRRRQFIRSGVAGTVTVALGGCLDGEESTPTPTSTETPADTVTGTSTATPEPSGELTVATYSAFVDAPSSSPGAWIKEQFEAEYDATIEYATPENELNHYIQRAQQGVDVDADVYVGLNVDHLIKVDETFGDDEPLFVPIADRLDNYGQLIDGLAFDPQDRSIPYDTGYISLVYDENEVSNPGTFSQLSADRYAGKLLAQNAQTSATGRAFMLWTVHEFGPEAYLPYWEQLVDNDVRILGDWSSAYNAYSNGEAPIVVSYSTDQVYANRYDQDMSRHQVGFLNDQGYANPEGMAMFADTDNEPLARAFLDFMLSKAVQSEIPNRNVQFPATDWAEPGEEFRKFAHEPPQPVTFSYDELAGNVEAWVDEWARQIASK